MGRGLRLARQLVVAAVCRWKGANCDSLVPAWRRRALDKGVPEAAMPCN